MYANKCIECTVTECANHAQTSNYCALDKILVGTHECNPRVQPHPGSVHRLHVLP